MINLHLYLVKNGISYVKSEQSHVLKVLQTMEMVDGRSMKNVHVVDIMSQYSIIGHLFHRMRFVNKLLHMILTSTGEKLNELQTTQ